MQLTSVDVFISACKATIFFIPPQFLCLIQNFSSNKKTCKSENGSHLFRFELPFPNCCLTVVAQQHQVLCISYRHDLRPLLSRAVDYFQCHRFLLFPSVEFFFLIPVPPLIAFFFQKTFAFFIFSCNSGTSLDL